MHVHGSKEGNVLFNDTLNTFYLRVYGVRHMVKDHSDSEKGNPLPPHRLLFTINSKGYFICTIPQTGYTYLGICYTSRGTLVGTRKAKWVHHIKDRSDDPSHHKRTPLPRSYISLGTSTAARSSCKLIKGSH